jgi:hypothetical protein
MGLMVHSLSEFPVSAERDYYLFVLRGGWDGEIEEALKRNFSAMADTASRTRSAVIMGTEARHFQNEVFSWHHINGEEAEALLPALLITTIHPHRFQDEGDPYWADAKPGDHMLLVPLRDHCKTEVVLFIQKVFTDIKAKKKLENFEVKKKMQASRGKALLDGLVLRPSFMGIGFDLKTIPALFKGK